MSQPEPPPRHSLQARLTLFYATGIYAAAIVVLAVVDGALVGINSARPVGRSGTGATTSVTHGVPPHQLIIDSAVALAVLIPIALALGWFIAGRFLQPLRAITATAKAISAGNLHQRLELGAPTDELTELGHTLDDLFARLQASFEAQRHFVANASHELRTPLAGLRTLLEVTLANPDADVDTLKSACKEALALGEHQERLVQALLALATSERGVTRWDTLDLAHVAQHVTSSRREELTKRGLHLSERLEPAVTKGDPRMIESLVANLIDNAVRHNHPEGHVEITTETAGRHASITVANSGPVIPEDQLQRLFQPFQRLSDGRNGRHDGYGLGLPIVNAVVEAHHATLTARTQPQGGMSLQVAFNPAVTTDTALTPKSAGQPSGHDDP
jgi:signal transduction histidine kinase